MHHLRRQNSAIKERATVAKELAASSTIKTWPRCVTVLFSPNFLIDSCDESFYFSFMNEIIEGTCCSSVIVQSQASATQNLAFKKKNTLEGRL